MLILERHSGEAIYINDNIKLTIYYHQGKQIKMGIEAPRHISVMREELQHDHASTHNTIKNTPKKNKHNTVQVKTKRRKRLILPDA